MFECYTATSMLSSLFVSNCVNRFFSFFFFRALDFCDSAEMEGMKNIFEWGLVFWRVSPFSSSFSSRLINRVCLCWGIFWGYHQSVSWLMVCCISSELHVMPTPIRWLQLKRWFVKSKSLAAKLVYQFGSLTNSRNTAGSVVDSLLRVKMFCFCFLYCRGGSINYMDSKVDINI